MHILNPFNLPEGLLLGSTSSIEFMSCLTPSEYLEDKDPVLPIIILENKTGN